MNPSRAFAWGVVGGTFVLIIILILWATVYTANIVPRGVDRSPTQWEARETVRCELKGGC